VITDLKAQESLVEQVRTLGIEIVRV
jgi:hypothetical protein